MKPSRLIILTLALTAVLVGLALWRPGTANRPGMEPGQVDRTVEITARQFAYTPDTVHVNVGERVRLVLTTADVAHSLAIREYGINLIVTPGEPASTVFTADRAGRYVIVLYRVLRHRPSPAPGTLIVGAGEDGERP